MGLTLGDGLTIMSITGFVLAVFWRLLPMRNAKNKDSTPDSMPVPLCWEHSGVCKAIENIESWLESISTDVKHLLERQ